MGAPRVSDSGCDVEGCLASLLQLFQPPPEHPRHRGQQPRPAPNPAPEGAGKGLPLGAGDDSRHQPEDPLLEAVCSQVCLQTQTPAPLPGAFLPAWQRVSQEQHPAVVSTQTRLPASACLGEANSLEPHQPQKEKSTQNKGKGIRRPECGRALLSMFWLLSH